MLTHIESTVWIRHNADFGDQKGDGKVGVGEKAERFIRYCFVAVRVG